MATQYVPITKMTSGSDTGWHPFLGAIPFVELYLSQGQGAGQEKIPLHLMDHKFDDQPVDVLIGGKASVSATPCRLFLHSLQHEISATTTGGNKIMLQIIDPNWDYVETLVAKEFAKGTEFYVRYGWRGIDDNRTESPFVVPFVIMNITMELTPFRGALITIHGRDKTVSLDEAPDYSSFTPTTTVYDAITSLITNAKFVPVVDPGLRKVMVGQEFGYCGRAPMLYIRDLLNNIAQNHAGMANYLIFIKNSSIAGNVEVHVQPSGDPAEPKRVYVYGRDRTGPMLSFTPQMNKNLILSFGGGRSSAITVDPQTKRILITGSTQAEDPSSGPYKSIKTPTLPSIVLESPFTPQQTQALAAVVRQGADSVQYEGDALIVGDTELFPMDYVDILVLKGGASFSKVQTLTPNDIHWFSSGRWMLRKVTHQISAEQSFQTNLHMTRFGGFVGEGVAGFQVPVKFQETPKTVDSPKLTEVLPVSNPGEASLVKTVLGFFGSFV